MKEKYLVPESAVFQVTSEATILSTSNLDLQKKTNDSIYWDED